MLSYRHLFHAGNPADVFKHAVLVLIIDYIQQKPKPFIYIDTHASTGLYDLNSAMAKKNTEYLGGISKIYNDHNIPVELSRYIACIKDFNQNGTCDIYPGSAAIAQQLSRSIDRGLCYELHPTDFCHLQQNLNATNFKAKNETGFSGLLSLLPPKEARGLILIDPSYEVKSEYQTTILTLKKALKKFAHGTYMIWYPILNQKENHQFRVDLSELAIGKSLQTELLFAPLKQTHGLKGSGLFIINPPYLLEDQINGLRPYLEEKFSSAFNPVD